MDFEELAGRGKKPPAITPGEELSAFSVHELERRIVELEAEILRCRDAIGARGATKSAAENIFRR